MSEHPSHCFVLPQPVPIYIGRQEFVVEYARGKKVLHLGCVDAGHIEQKQRKELWLHARIDKVAESLWGVDIDEVGIEIMRAQGYTNLYLADIENLGGVKEIIDQEFDLLLLTEVIEHLNNPGKLLSSLLSLFKPATELLVTVPNAPSLSNILENLRGRELVHPDHNYWFSLHTIQSLFNKYGYDAICVGVYSQHNYHRSLGGHLWKRLLHYAGIRSPRDTSAAYPGGSPVRKSRLGSWLSAATTTIIYRIILSRRPFFADGLILIVKPRPPDPGLLSTG